MNHSGHSYKLRNTHRLSYNALLYLQNEEENGSEQSDVSRIVCTEIDNAYNKGNHFVKKVNNNNKTLFKEG